MTHEAPSLASIEAGLRTEIPADVVDFLDGLSPTDRDAALAKLVETVTGCSAEVASTADDVDQKMHRTPGGGRFKLLIVPDEPDASREVHARAKKLSKTRGFLPYEQCGGCNTHVPKGSWKKCGRCKAVWYCSRRCHRWHWRNGHKEVCRESEEQ